MSLFYSHLKDLTVVVAQDTFPSHFFSSLLLLSEIAHHEESNLTLMVSLGLLRVDAELCAIPPLGASAQAVAHRRKGRKIPAAFLTDSEELLFLQGSAHLQPMTPAQRRVTFVLGAENSTLQLCLPWKSSWFPKAVDGN